jgi:hypothetical protein
MNLDIETKISVESSTVKVLNQLNHDAVWTNPKCLETLIGDLQRR